MARGLRLLMIALLVVAALIVALPFALDTGPGRAWAARQIAGYSLESGLSLHIARINGSLWSKATLEGVELHDAKGRFATAPRVVLDWTPLALADNRFEAAELGIKRATLERLPQLNPTSDPRILPSIDIRIDWFALDRLEIAKGVAGPPRALRAKGQINLQAGSALVDLEAAVANGNDALVLHLEAEPDRDRFALHARLNAPAGGLVTTLARLNGPLVATAIGRGRWQDWNGGLTADFGAARLVELVLAGKAGTLSARGRVDPAPLLAGSFRQALAGGLALVAEAAPEGDLTRVALTLNGTQMTGALKGRIHRQNERWTESEAKLALATTSPLARGWGVDDGRITARLAGPLLAPLIDARVMAKRLLLPGGLALNGLSAAGIANLNETGLSAPLTVTVASIGGLPDMLAPLAGNWRAEGRLAFARGALTGENLSVRSGPLLAGVGLNWVPAKQAWGVTINGIVRGWTLEQLGSSNAALRLNLKPGPAGSIAGGGDFQLVAAKPTAGGLTRISGGGLTLTGRFALLPGLAVNLSDLALSAPKLTATGRASWNAGRFMLASGGKSQDWGNFTLEGDGTPAAPRFAAQLAKPGYGLSAVALRFEPSASGWQVRGDAQSALGPIMLEAGLALSPVLQLDIARLTAADFTARGQLDQTAVGPFAGTLNLSGKGLNGVARLSATGSLQTAEVALAGDRMNLPLTTPLTIDRLRLAAQVQLAEDGPDIKAALELAGLERGSLVVEQAKGILQLANGKGDASLSLSGSSGEAFSLAFTAELARNRWQISGGGNYDDRSAKLVSPAVITHDQAGWHLASVTLSSALGNVELAGDWGDTSRVNARLDKMSLQMVNFAYPSLNLAGRISGTLAVAQSGDAAPTGTAALRLNGLSRSNVTSTSTPIDVGLNAALGPSGTVMRAVIVRAGKVEGRAQARLGPIRAGDDDLVSKLFDASVAGQLRYAGPAQDLWGLSGLTALDVRGQVQLAADVSGTLGDPQVAGVIKGDNGRVEAPLLGAVATEVDLDARFSASKLELTRFVGKSGAGSITGSGSIDLSYERGFPMDIRMVAKEAAILGRDDVTATGSGNIRVATDEYGGVVSGTITLARAQYTVGRTAVADVPVLQVTEKNARVLGRRTLAYIPPTRWLFNLAIKSDRGLKVAGMGINSEWQTDVRLRGGTTTPELFGRVQLVRGDYDFAGKRFQLTRGDIRFVGGYPPDPIITVTAENTGSGFTAYLNVEGTAQRPQIKFSSVPSLPEDEVLSRVLFGTRVTDLSAPEAIQLAGALTSLRGGGFNPIGAVGKGLGIDRLRILPADIATGRKTAVAAGQYVGRNIYVELATDASGYTATSIEIGLTRTLSVLSQVATLGGTSASVRWTKDY